jgi:Ni2+-binding GTPase involved in maturation of urease and hydrogenase
MRVADLMSRHPLTVTSDTDGEELRHLLEISRVHHVPLMDGDRLVGLWVATGPDLDLHPPDAVLEMQADETAQRAMEALLDDRLAVLVRDGERPVGVLTRTNVIDFVHTALIHDVGKRTAHPILMRVVGPADAGKTTLLARTLPLLRHCPTAMVTADPPSVAEAATGAEPGAEVLHVPEAHWARSVHSWITQVAEARLVLLEDEAPLPYLGGGLMDDALILVVCAGREGEIADQAIKRAAAVVLTKADGAPPEFDPAAACAALQARVPSLAVFCTAAGADERGLAEWADWIERRVLARPA